MDHLKGVVAVVGGKVLGRVVRTWCIKSILEKSSCVVVTFTPSEEGLGEEHGRCWIEQELGLNVVSGWS